MPKQQELIQTQKQLSAYDKQTVHQLFRLSLEWLEKYVEVVYPDYKIRKQIHDDNIKRQDANDPNKVEGLFTGALFGFKVTIEIAGKPKFLYDEVKEEYYKWLGGSGIDVNNCPERLRHFLVEVNEILEGRGDKFERDIANRKWQIDPHSPEYEEAINRLFTNIQEPLGNARREYESLKGKSHKDIKIENNFAGSGEQVKKVFQEISGRYDYQGFHFLPQDDDRSSVGVDSSNVSRGIDFQQRPSSVIVRNVKQDPNHWRIDEVIINGERKIALVHHSVLDEEVDLNSQPVYLPQRFNQEEINEINRVLNISQSPTSSSSYYHQQEPTNSSVSPSQDNNSGKGGIFAIIGVVSALLIAGGVVIKKRLSRKIKR